MLPAALAICAAVTAVAQAATTFGQNLDPLFQGILARPSDFNNALQYAALAPSTDIESAISTYEQLLFYNPNLASVRFELGVLYYRLGSFEMARGYFASALKMKDMTPGLRERTEELIAAIDRKLQPDQLDAFVRSRKKKVLEKLRVRLDYERTHSFFLCKNCLTGRVTFEEAMESAFRCIGCNGSLISDDNAKTVQILEDVTRKLASELAEQPSYFENGSNTRLI